MAYDTAMRALRTNDRNSPPPGGADDAASAEHDASRARFFRKMLLALPTLILFMVVALYVSGGGWEVTVLPTSLSALLIVLRPMVGRSASFDRVVYHLFAGGAMTVVVGGAWLVGGGLGGPEMVSLPILPILMSFLLGRRGAIAWTAVAIGWVLVLGLLEHRVQQGLFDAHQLHLSRIGAYVTTLTIGVLVGSGYSESVLRQARALARSRDEARAASAAKSAFLATMSHEIRTPLGAILGVVELLERSRLTPEQASRVELLRRSADGLNALIGDVLDLARIESGRESVHAAPVDLARLVREVVDLFSARAEAKGLSLTAEGLDTPLWVVTDALRVRQILVNLVANAVKFTDKGFVRVRVSYSDVQWRAGIEIVVEDSGPGVPPAQQAAIFEAFTQGDAGRGQAGSGLGLAIGARLAALLGGTLSVHSPGVGASFTLRFEATRCEAPPPVAAPDGAVQAGLRVLLVEDNPINQLVFSALLAEEGCVVQVAADGEAGVEVALKEPPDLVFMDMRMPGVDGLEATRRLRRAGSRLPIVALTANALPEDRVAAAEAGMDGFLTKPLNIDALRQVLRGVRPRA